MSRYGTITQTFERNSGSKASAFKSFLLIRARRYYKVHTCITSKAGILVLVWSFVISLMYYLLYHTLDLEIYAIVMNNRVVIAHYAIKALVFCFFPFAGFLADNKFGRFKTVLCGIVMMMGAFVLMCVLPSLLRKGDLVSKILIGLVCLTSIVPFICVNANIIQFGVDQLHDSPAEHQSLFIHWHVWAWYLGSLIAKLETRLELFKRSYLFLSFNLTVAVFLLVSIVLAYCKQIWFLIDSAQLNPYKVVYKVTKFAHLHKVPIQRSALTYYEDAVPSGLDLGKTKYGGPFTTEQVEDVKVFYGILKILLALGPSFALNFASTHAPPRVEHSNIFKHFNHVPISYILRLYLLEYGLLTSLLVVISIPLYLCLIRPLILYHIPQMLKRIGLGIAVKVLSLFSNLTMIIIFQHRYGTDINCRTENVNSSDILLSMNSTEVIIQDYVLAVQCCLSSFSIMLIYISLYEFICSQSPHSMKGLLLGLAFALQGIFQGIGMVIIIPFWFASNLPFFRCWMYYFIINILFGMAGLFVYTCVARRYKFRERDEFCHFYRYAEDYYSRVQDERLNDIPDTITLPTT